MCFLDLPDDKAMENFDLEFPTVAAQGVARYYLPASPIEFYLRGGGDTVQGQIYDQALQYAKLGPSQTIRFCQGDYARSLRPNSDTMAYFSSLALTSSDGFLFVPENNSDFQSPVLLSVGLPEQYSLGLNDSFEVTSVGITPRGDTYWSTNTPLLHRLTTNLGLRNASIQLRLQPRDGSADVLCEIAPRGSFQIKLAFYKIK